KEGLLNDAVHVACPDCIKAHKAVIYLNGIKASAQDLTMLPRTSPSTNVIFQLPAPAHDAHLVCVAFGEGVKDPSWKTLQGYTLAITNPIFIDGDNDGKYSSPRETALALLTKGQPLTLQAIAACLKNVDAAVGVQILSEAK